MVPIARTLRRFLILEALSFLACLSLEAHQNQDFCTSRIVRLAASKWRPLSETEPQSRSQFPRSILVQGIGSASRQCVGNCRHHGPLRVFEMMAKSRGLLNEDLSPAYLTLQEMKMTALRALEDPQVWRNHKPDTIPDDHQVLVPDLLDEFGVLPKRLGISERRLSEVAEKLFALISEYRSRAEVGRNSESLLKFYQGRIHALIRLYQGDPDQAFQVGSTTFTPRSYAEYLGIRYLPRKSVGVNLSNRPEEASHPRSFDELLMDSGERFQFQNASVTEAAELIESILSRGIPLDLTMNVLLRENMRRIRLEQFHSSRLNVLSKEDAFRPGVKDFKKLNLQGLHALSVVGLSYDSSGEPFLIIQNSWGVTRHGPHGLLRLPLRELLKDPEFKIEVPLPLYNAPPTEALLSTRFFGDGSPEAPLEELNQKALRRRSERAEWFQTFIDLANQATRKIVEVRQANEQLSQSESVVLARASAFRFLQFLYRKAQDLHLDLYALENWIASRQSLALSEFLDRSEILELEVIASNESSRQTNASRDVRVNSFDVGQVRFIPNSSPSSRQGELINPIDSLRVGPSAWNLQESTRVNLPYVREQNVHAWALDSVMNAELSMERPADIRQSNPKEVLESLFRILHLAAHHEELKLHPVLKKRVRWLFEASLKNLKLETFDAEALQCTSEAAAKRMHRMIRDLGIEDLLGKLGLQVSVTPPRGANAAEILGQTAAERFSSIPRHIQSGHDTAGLDEESLREYWLNLAEPDRNESQQEIFFKFVRPIDFLNFWKRNQSRVSVKSTNLKFFLKLLDQLPDAQQAEVLSVIVKAIHWPPGIKGLAILTQMSESQMRDRFENEFLMQNGFDETPAEERPILMASLRAYAISSLGREDGERMKMPQWPIVSNESKKNFKEYRQEILKLLHEVLSSAQVLKLERSESFIDLLNLGIRNCPDIFDEPQALENFLAYLKPDDEGYSPWNRPIIQNEGDHLKELQDFIRTHAVRLGAQPKMQALMEDLASETPQASAWRPLFVLGRLMELGIPRPKNWTAEKIEASLAYQGTFNTVYQNLKLSSENLHEYFGILRNLFERPNLHHTIESTLAHKLVSFDWRSSKLSAAQRAQLMRAMLLHLNLSEYQEATKKAIEWGVTSRELMEFYLMRTNEQGEDFVALAYEALGKLGNDYRDLILQQVEPRLTEIESDTPAGIHLRFALAALNSSKRPQALAELRTLALSLNAMNADLARLCLVDLGERSEDLRTAVWRMSEGGGIDALRARIRWPDDSAEFSDLLQRELAKRKSSSLEILKEVRQRRPSNQSLVETVQSLLKLAPIDPRDAVSSLSESASFGRPSDEEIAFEAQLTIKAWGK